MALKNIDYQRHTSLTVLRAEHLLYRSE